MKLDNKAQVSFEMIILLAAVVAIAIIFVTNLQSTATSARDKLSQKSTDVLSKIDEIK